MAHPVFAWALPSAPSSLCLPVSGRAFTCPLRLSGWVLGRSALCLGCPVLPACCCLRAMSGVWVCAVVSCGSCPGVARAGDYTGLWDLLTASVGVLVCGMGWTCGGRPFRG